MIGDLLDESHWTAMLTDSRVTTAGRADSYINASHLKRTRHAHQVTALALGQLESEAYDMKKMKIVVHGRYGWKREAPPFASGSKFRNWNC